MRDLGLGFLEPPTAQKMNPFLSKPRSHTSALIDGRPSRPDPLRAWRPSDLPRCSAAARKRRSRGSVVHVRRLAVGQKRLLSVGSCEGFLYTGGAL